MLFLIIAIIALAVSTQMRSRKYVSLSLLVVGVFYVSLITWILFEGGLRVFAGGEAGLLGWFIGGLVFSLLGQMLPNKPPVAILVAALCYAMGFDVLQPDSYSYVPAAILGALIWFVASQAFWRLQLQDLGKKTARLAKGKVSRVEASKIFRNSSLESQLLLALYILAIAILVYASIFKVIDRGWLLPWNYLAAAGGILFAVSQLWSGLKTKDVPLWAQVAAGRLGELLMVVSAFFVYREFL